MDGLECKEMNLSTVSVDNEVFRFDAEYFNKNALFVVEKIKKGKHALIEKNFDVSKLAGFEFTEYFTPENMNSENGYIAVTSKNIQKNQLVLNDYITIDREVADNYLGRSKLKVGDVVLSYTGEYRRALTLFKENLQLGPNVCRLTPIGDDIDSKFLSVFLNSKIGQIILDKEKTLSAQPTVAMSRIRKIPVPIFDKLQKKIADIVITSNDLINRADNEFGLAQDLLSKSLKIKVSKDNGIVIKTYRNSMRSTGRLDAEYYLSRYESIEKQIIGDNTVSNSCKIHDTNFSPSISTTYQYIELANVDTTGGISNVEYWRGVDLPSRGRRLVQAGQVIVSSIEGSLSSCALITPEFTGAVCSTGFYVVSSKEYNSETLLILFKSEFVQALLKKGCSGTILTSISKDEFGKIPLPAVDKSIQKEIAVKVKKAIQLRETSKIMLGYATKAVEVAVEEGEDAAVKWLNEITTNRGCEDDTY